MKPVRNIETDPGFIALLFVMCVLLLVALALAGCAPAEHYPGCARDGQLLAEWPDGITRRVVDARGVRVDCIFP